MIGAAVKALAQMFSPPFRWVLLKSAGLALVLIVLIAIGLHRLLVWVATTGADWAETVFGISAHAPLSRSPERERSAVETSASSLLQP